MKHRLFPIEELSPGETRSVTIGRVRVMIVRKPDGSVRALRDRCPHMGALLSNGCSEYAVEGGDVGQVEYCDKYVVRCPWHYYEFDVDTGVSLADAAVWIKAYDVTVEDEHIVVER